MIIRLDREPTAAEAGKTLRYLYEATLSLGANTDLPINEATYRALLPVVVQWFERSLKQDFDVLAFSLSLERAIKAARRMPLPTRYGRR